MASHEYNIAFMIAGKLSGEFKKAFDAAGNVIGVCDKKLAGLNSRLKDVQALSAQRQELSRLGKNYLAARHSLSAYEKAVHGAGQAVNRNSREYLNLARAVERAGQAYQSAKTQMQDFAKQNNLKGIGAAGLSAKQATLKEEINKRRSIAAFKGKFSENIGNFAVAGQATISVFTDIIKTGAQFESQMLRVGAVSNASATDLAKLTEQAKQLGAETVWSATEAAQGQEFLAMAGFKTGEILKAMPGMLSLASAGHIDLASAADIASNVLTGFSLSAEEISRVGDVMAKATSNANIDMRMFGETFKYVAPIAKAAGVSLEQAAAMAGKLGDAGIQGTMAGTTLRGVLSRIATAGSKLSALGIQTTDSQGKLRNYLDILDELAKKLSTMGNAQSLGILKDIFGDNAFSGAKALIDQAQRGTLREFEQSLIDSKGTAERMATQQTSGSEGQYKAMTSAMESLKLTAFEKLAPILTTVANNLTTIITKVNDWAKENPGLADTILVVAGALAGITAVAVPVAIATSVLSVAFTGLSTAFTLLSSTALGPVLAIAGIALALWALYENWDEICGFFRQVGDRMLEGFNLILNFVSGIFTNAWNAAWEGVKNIFGNIFDSLVRMARTPLNFIIDLINKVIGKLNSLGSIDIAGVKMGINIPQIPKLAQGGVVSQPTLAMIGEGREPEAVMPLSRLSEITGNREGTVITFAPVINIQGGSGDAYEQVKRGLSEGQDSFRQQIERYLTDRRRLSFA